MMKYKLVIKQQRKLKGMTQEELSDMVNVSQSYLSEIEDNKHDIKLSLLGRIAIALNLHPRDLYQK